MYRPVFARPPESWTEWWSAVRHFVAGWYGIPPGEVRGYAPEVESLSRQLDLSLSPSIHEWACFAADLTDERIFDRAVRDRLTLAWDGDIEAVILLTLAEGDVCWGVQREHLGDNDPRVGTWMLSGGDRRGWRWWRPHTQTTSQFALQHLIAYLRPAGGGFSKDVPPSAELIDRLRSLGQSSVELGDSVLIEDDDLIILVGRSLWSANDETDISVQVGIGASRIGAIPQALIDLARTGGGMFYGAFRDLRQR